MRNFIDIITEFQLLDVEKHLNVDDGGYPPFPPEDEDGGDDGNNQTIIVYDILWDVEDDEREHLPTRVSTTLHDVEDAADPYADEEDQDDLMSKIGQWLQATYHDGLSNFSYRIVY